MCLKSNNIIGFCMDKLQRRESGSILCKKVILDNIREA